MRPLDIVRKKRDGGELSSEEIQFLVRAYTRDEIPDCQIAAWLMAVVIRGMTRPELSALTAAMLHSGEVLDLSDISAAKIDRVVERNSPRSSGRRHSDRSAIAGRTTSATNASGSTGSCADQERY